MNEYVSKDIVVKNVLDQMLHSKSLIAMHERIMNLEAADVVERKRGKWMKAVQGFDESWVCSECMEEYVSVDADFEDYAHFCPNYGTEMINNET